MLLIVIVIVSVILPTGSSLVVRAQRPIEIERRADQTEVRERLRKVAERLARGARLLGIEAEVVRVTQHLLEHQARPL